MARAKELFQHHTGSTNKDNYPDHKPGLKEHYLQMLLTNTVGNTYYMAQNELFAASNHYHTKMAEVDPGYMAKAAVYARNKGFMRLQPVMALAYLSKLENKEPFKNTFMDVIKTPQDLIDFVTIVGSIRKGKGMGRSIKKQINHFLSTMTEYWAIKYGGNKDGWSLGDIIKASHPNPANKNQSALFAYVAKRDVKIPKEMTQVRAIEILKSLDPEAPDYAKKAVFCIKKGKLPHEIVTGIIKPNTAIWTYLMREMPLLALTRNINTLARAGVLAVGENKEYLIQAFNNKEWVQRSKVFPFQFLRALENLLIEDKEIEKALSNAAEASLENLNVIPGSTAWFLDISGSMNGEFLEIGTLLGLSGLKKSEKSLFLCFSHMLCFPPLKNSNSLMQNVRAVRDMDRGGTNHTLCMEYLLGRVKDETSGWRPTGYDHLFPEKFKTSKPLKVDNIIMITDEQQNTGTPMIKAFKEYRRKVNPNAKLAVIDVSPYDSRIALEEERGVHFIYGWNNNTLDVLHYIFQDNKQMSELV